MTEAELLALAKKEALQTTVTPDQFLLSVRTIPSYDYKQAHWYKAMKALEQLKQPKPPPPPIPNPVDLAPVRNLLVFATVTDDALVQVLTLPARWKVLFSADPVYRPTQAQARAVGGRGYAWCDCRTTLPAAAKTMAATFGLSGWYGQGENAGEFDVCLAAGGDKAIVNLSALTPTQLLSVASARVLVTNENYRNVHPAERPDWRNANQGIGGNCGAVYESASEGAIYTSAASQIRNGWFGYHDSWYVEGFQPQDWQALRGLG